MDSLLLQYTLLFLGTAAFVWGTFIVGSDTFFEYWQNRYWRDKKGQYKKREMFFYNRYVTGLSTLLLGVTIIWLVFIKF